MAADNRLKTPVRDLKGIATPESFTIKDLSMMVAEKDMNQPIHRHNFYFMLMIEKGKGEHIVDFVHYAISSVSVFFMRPGQVHQLSLKKGSTGVLIAFNQEFYSPQETAERTAFRTISNMRHCKIKQESLVNTFSIMSAIMHEYLSKKKYSNDAIKAWLKLLFIELAREKNNLPDTDKPNPYAQQRYEELMELLEKNITQSKEVTAYAQMMNLSIYQLNALTKEMAGKTCSQVSSDHLILEAKRQLLATAKLVNQIAYTLGYEDDSYFTRFFKKQTVYSPENFRKNFA